jgi:hypothetical protein
MKRSNLLFKLVDLFLIVVEMSFGAVFLEHCQDLFHAIQHHFHFLRTKKKMHKSCKPKKKNKTKQKQQQQQQQQQQTTEKPIQKKMHTVKILR